MEELTEIAKVLDPGADVALIVTLVVWLKAERRLAKIEAFMSVLLVYVRHHESRRQLESQHEQ